MKSVLDKFTREDLPNEGLRLLSDVIGVNQVKAMMVQLPGMTFHVPKDFHKQSDLNYIRKNADRPVEEIALALGCSVRTVYRKLDSIKAD